MRHRGSPTDNGVESAACRHEVMEQTAFALRPVPRRRRGLGVAARVLAVVGAHAAIILALAQVHPELRQQIEPLFVSLITPPQPKVEPPPVEVPKVKPRPEAKPVPRKPQAEAPAPSRPIQAPVERAPVSETALSAPPAAPAPEAASVEPGPGTSSGATGTGKGGASAPVVAPRFDVAYLNNPRPEYPRISRRMGEQGKVLLHVFVNAAGQAEKVEIRNSSGYARLDESAREAVRRWKFVPARQGDQPVSAWVLVPVSFVLES
jgi:protein TonB